MATRGYSGNMYDRYVEQTETSTLHRMKETYWTTKQAVIKKLGKKEDEHVVASDSQLDSKLEVFKAIQKSSMDLLRANKRYQDRLLAIAQEENAMGRFLKTQTAHDKTRAGKMMAAVGKSQSFSAQQRLALRVPLVRLYQEVETFRYQAISDTLMTVNRMESARTEYRGALLWMKNVSEELDPDTFKQLEKFRKVQAQVRKTKAKFDKLKLDVMQKIDLLAASRCNMFSHVLANYQSTLLHFWEKTSRTMTAVSESFKGYQYYEFNMLKELAEPAKKVAEDMGQQDGPQKDNGEDFDPEKLLFGDEYTDEVPESTDAAGQNGSLTNLYNGQGKQGDQAPPPRVPMDVDPASIAEFIDFGADEKSRLKDEDFDFSGKIPDRPESESKKKQKPGEKDLLCGTLEPDDTEKDELTLLREILDAPSTGEDEFTQEWSAVFGNTAPSGGQQTEGAHGADFLPSSLLDLGSRPRNQASPAQGRITSDNSTMGAGIMTGGQSKPAASQDQKPKPGKKGQKTDMSAWFSLFADLDPLSDPDAIGKTPDKVTDA